MTDYAIGDIEKRMGRKEERNTSLLIKAGKLAMSGEEGTASPAKFGGTS